MKIYGLVNGLRWFDKEGTIFINLIINMDLNQLIYKIKGCIFNTYNSLGPGLLEGVYEEVLCYELKSIGLNAQRQVELPIVHKGVVLNSPLRMDIIVNDEIIIELKSVEELKSIYFKQLYTYLTLSKKRKGLLVNFNTDNLLDNIHILTNQNLI